MMRRVNPVWKKRGVGWGGRRRSILITRVEHGCGRRWRR
jgi:hypothetical protein